MKYTQSFIKTLKEVPADADSINASYLERAGFIEKQMAGVYALLPLGFKVYKKIESIIREEMNAIGGQELLMNILQPKELWDETGRWAEGKDVMYQFKDARDQQIGLGWTHEEQIVDIVRKKIQSYKDLPQALYQIHSKFRNEPRAKSGLLRGREFMMKDLYSFHADEADFNRFYEEVKQAYLKIFKRLGLEVRVVAASGGLIAKYSHEFQVFTEVGEDTIFYCEKCDFAQNKEIAEVKEGDKCPNCDGEIKMAHGIELGNIFSLKSKYSEPMKATYADKNGAKKVIIMGCYGIGITRTMGALVEVSHDDFGLIWPESVAPYRAVLIDLTGKADSIYEKLVQAGIEMLYDDRAVPAGVKFSDADLLGIPYRLVVSEKTGDQIEIKKRTEKESHLDNIDNIIKNLGQ